MPLAAAALLLALAVTEGQHRWPTLREELASHRIDAGGFWDADQAITSYAVKNDEDWFAIAYYWHTGTDLLPSQLRIRMLDRKTGVWRYAEIGEKDREGGSALRIERCRGVIYVDLHVTPSAGDILVLDEEGRLRRHLEG